MKHVGKAVYVLTVKFEVESPDSTGEEMDRDDVSNEFYDMAIAIADDAPIPLDWIRGRHGVTAELVDIEFEETQP